VREWWGQPGENREVRTEVFNTFKSRKHSEDCDKQGWKIKEEGRKFFEILEKDQTGFMVESDHKKKKKKQGVYSLEEKARS